MDRSVLAFMSCRGCSRISQVSLRQAGWEGPWPFIPSPRNIYQCQERIAIRNTTNFIGANVHTLVSQASSWTEPTSPDTLSGRRCWPCPLYCLTLFSSLTSPGTTTSCFVKEHRSMNMFSKHNKTCYRTLVMSVASRTGARGRGPERDVDPGRVFNPCSEFGPEIEAGERTG